MERIVLDFTSSHKFNKHYQFGIGSGHATLALRKDYLEQLKLIHDTLGIKQVRFHGIFNEDMNVFIKLSDVIPVPGSDRFVDICFDRIGEVFDNILEIGMKPFVELSFMPKHLSKNLDQKVMFYYQGYSSMPKDDEEWKNFIKSFIRYLLDRYGEEEVLSWNFEVWNEPNLIVFFGGSKEDYFHLYEITAKAIKEVNKNIKVGGPSTSGTNWIDDFIEFVNHNDIPIDFVSTHQYAGDPIGQMEGSNLENKEHGSPFSNPNILKDVPSGSVLDGLRHVFIDKSEIIDIPNNSLIINALNAKKKIGNLPLYYTEWNENATFSASTNDTRKVASYLIYTILNTEDSIDGSSVWCFSDIFEELHMFNEEFHGGFGLLSRHGIKKPSYYALNFLTQVGEERFDHESLKEDITYASFKDEKGDIQLILTRQNMKNLDLPKKQVDVELPLNDVKKITLQRIDEESGNPLKSYQKLDRKSSLRKEDIKAIEEESEVKEEEIEFIKEKGYITISLNLGINDVHLVKIYR